MYDYQKERDSVFTPSGADTLLQVWDRIRNLCKASGCTTVEIALNTISGDSWHTLACVDFLIETGRVREIPDPERASRNCAVLVTKGT